MTRDDEQKAELYQVMLVCVATALVCFKVIDGGEVDAVVAADNIIQAAHKKATERYVK